MVVIWESASCGPTVSRASSAKRSASSILPGVDEQLGERALRLAEVRAVAELLEDLHGLAQTLLRLLELAALPRERAEVPEPPGDPRLEPDLAVELERLA